jgi:glycerophosphoryl diester phosphodiesterase
MREIGAAGIDYHVSVFKNKPEWVKESHDLGLKVNVWTVNTPEDIQQMIDLNVDFITTDEPLLVKEVLDKQY